MEPIPHEWLRELIGGYEDDQDRPGYIGGYKICNRHGPHSGPSCQKCQQERNEWLTEMVSKVALMGFDCATGKDWTGVKVMKAPTEAQLRDFDFWMREAPAKATHCALLPSGEIEWQKRLPMRAVQRWSERLMLWEDIGPQTDGKMFLRPAKPAKEWDGEGLPPVGCEVEMSLGFHCGIQAKITYMGDGVFCYRNLRNGGEYTGAVSDSTFRPLRTKEQREREVVVATALSHIPPGATSHDGVMLSDYTDRLYDAGMLRKVE